MQFSKISEQRLSTCHEDLQKLMNRVVEKLDISIVCGHRGEKDQNEAVKNGLSKLTYPNSKHNRLPSEAVDLAFWDGKKISWDEKQASYVAGYTQAMADDMGIAIRLGGDWNRDRNVTNEKFIDLPHVELVK